MPRFHQLPLQLIAFLIVPSLILVLLVAFGGVAIHQASMRDMVVDHNLHAVEGGAQILSDRLAERLDVLSALDGGTIDPAVATLFEGGAAVYGRDGQIAAATPDFPTADAADFLPDAGDRSVRVLLDGERVTLIAPAGEAGWAVGMTTPAALGWQEIAAGLHLAQSTFAYIMDGEGRIILRAGEVPGPMSLIDLPTGESGNRYMAGEQGRELVLSYAPIPAAGWTLVHGEYPEESLDVTTRYSQAAPLVLVPGVIIAGVALWLGLRQVVQPLQKLESEAIDLAWGDFDSIEQPVGGIEEIQQLQATLQHLAQRVQATETGMRHYIRAITDAQEDERARLARELHDETVQSLIALGHRAQQLRRHTPADGDAARIVEDLRVMARQAVEDLRRIIRAMRPIYLEELGLAPALDMLAHDLALADDMPDLHFEKAGEPQRLPPEHEINLYRIAQEALNNVRQHGDAKNAWLTIRFEDGAVNLTVRDDGQGFEAPRRVTDLPKAGHFGLMGMAERAALIGAHLQIESAPGEGTTLTVSVPLDGGQDQPG
jgi:signal transduction histidine kinase